MILSGWGRYPSIRAKGRAFETPGQLNRILQAPGDCIAHGMGRSYGDSALNNNVVFSSRFNKIYAFDHDSGIVTCECGITLAELAHVFMPKGWFLAVTPGTKFITMGGAIASDVHGKNHHISGCFSECLVSFDLMLPDGEVITCSRKKNNELFRATCGGMGLTGIILAAKIKLIRVKSGTICETVARCSNLEEIFDRFEEYRNMSYSMAWIDCFAKKENIGRSVIMAGELSDTGAFEPPPIKPLISIPFNLPGFVLNRYSISMFNRLYFKLHPLFKEKRLVPLDSFFYPLDSIGNWNRMYGKSGFTQYQFVLPKESSYEGLKIILDKIASERIGFLAVLKLLGPQNDNCLSFPLEGYTLALDFKIENKLFPFLNALDMIVMDLGGRLYLSKDARMNRDIFIKGYPDWEQFAEVREKWGLKKKFNSLQSLRLGI